MTDDQLLSEMNKRIKDFQSDDKRFVAKYVFGGEPTPVLFLYFEDLFAARVDKPTQISSTVMKLKRQNEKLFAS